MHNLTQTKKKCSQRRIQNSCQHLGCLLSAVLLLQRPYILFFFRSNLTNALALKLLVFLKISTLKGLNRALKGFYLFSRKEVTLQS